MLNTKPSIEPEWSVLPQLLTIRTVSQILHVHPNTLRQWDKSGKLRATRLGTRRDRRYEQSAVRLLYHRRWPAAPQIINKLRATSRLQRLRTATAAGLVLLTGLMVGLQAQAAPTASGTIRFSPETCVGWERPELARQTDVPAGAFTPDVWNAKAARFSSDRLVVTSNNDGVVTGNLDRLDETLHCRRWNQPTVRLEGDFQNQRLIVALRTTAARNSTATYIIEGSYDGGTLWKGLAIVPAGRENQDPIIVPLPQIGDISDLNNFQVRARPDIDATVDQTAAWIDGFTVELNVVARPVSVATRNQAASELNKLSAFSQAAYRSTEQPLLKVPKKQVEKFLFFTTKTTTWKVENLLTIDAAGQENSPAYRATDMKTGDDVFSTLHIDASKLRPGKYTLRLVASNSDGVVVTTEETFLWGVAAINITHAIARPGDEQVVAMGVLDDAGVTICDADLRLTITDPRGKVLTYSTDQKTVQTSGVCVDKGVTNTPDYSVTFQADRVGLYHLRLEANTQVGRRVVEEVFESNPATTFNIDRFDDPTRIYPLAKYPVRLAITPTRDFSGTVREQVPISFVITDVNPTPLVVQKNFDNKDRQDILWTVDWKQGQTYFFSYTFDAPNISPALFQTGPLAIGGDVIRGAEFVEPRQWQIASDSIVAIEAADFALEQDDVIDTLETAYRGDKNVDIKLFKKGFKLKPGKVKEGLGAAEPTTVTAVEVVDPAGETPVIVTTTEEFSQDGRDLQILHFAPPRQFRPGRYTLKLTVTDGTTTSVEERTFDWGVLAVNLRRSIERPSIDTTIGLAVLDDQGVTLCDETLDLVVTDPEGKKKTFKTTNNTIVKNPECVDKGVTNDFDYSAVYKTGGAGVYHLTMTAGNGKDARTIEDSFEVRGTVDFDIERTQFSMRIYPLADYETVLTIKANADYQGVVTDTVPASFVLKDISGDGTAVTTGDEQVISWTVDWVSGDTYTLGYTIDYPDVSPEYYLLGPLTVGPGGLDGPRFKEARQWQVASDVISVVAVDATASAQSENVDGDGRKLVWTNDTTGYLFYTDGTGSVGYSKTTNAGMTWGAAVVITAQTDCENFSIWYDQWTPGNTGTLIHIAFLENGTDDIYYEYLDTSGDTQKGEVLAVASATATHTALTDSVSITRATDGDLYIAASSSDASSVSIVRYSTDVGTNWNDTAAEGLDDASGDAVMVLPQPSGDIVMLRWDISAEDIQSKEYEDGGNAWDGAWTNIDTNAVDSTTLTETWAATLNPSRWEVLLAYVDNAGTTGSSVSDVRTAKYDGATWSATANTYTDYDTISGVTIGLDTITNDVFVGYLRGVAAGPTVVQAYYKISRDNMATWELERGSVLNFSGAFRGIMGNFASPYRISVWAFDDTGADIWFGDLQDIGSHANALLVTNLEGFETQSSLTTAVAVTGTPTYSTGVVRSGGASLRTDPSSSTEFVTHTVSYGANGKDALTNFDNLSSVFAMRVAAGTAISQQSIIYSATDGTTVVAELSINANQTLSLTTGTDVNGAFALVDDTWYVIAFAYGIDTDVLRVAIYSGDMNTLHESFEQTISSATTMDRFRIGPQTASTTADLYFDDFMVYASNLTRNFPLLRADYHIGRMDLDGTGTDTAWTNTYTNLVELPTVVSDASYIESQTAGQSETSTLESASSAGISGSVLAVRLTNMLWESSAATTSVNGIRWREGSNTENSSNVDTAGTAAAPINYSSIVTDEIGTTSLWDTTSLDALEVGVTAVTNETVFYRNGSSVVQVAYVPADTITISGTCQAFNQTDNCGDTGTVKVAVNGVLQAQEQTTVAGTWSIAGVAKPPRESSVTVFIDAAADADEAAAVTRYDGEGDLTGVTLFKEHLTIGSVDNQTARNYNLGLYDYTADEDILSDVDISAGNTLTVDAAGQSSQEEVHVLSGDTYEPYGTVTTVSTENVGTLTLQSQTWNNSADWLNSGTFNEGTSTVNFNGTTSGTFNSGCTNFDSCTNGRFYKITINKTDGADANDNLTLTTNGVRVANQLTITDGELIQGTLSVRAEEATLAVSIAAAGKWTNTSTGDLKLGGPFTTAGTATFNSNNGSQCTDAANDIVINSTVADTTRLWTNTGTLVLYNVEADDMTNSSITAYNSDLTDAQTTWVAGVCGITVSGYIFTDEGEGTPATDDGADQIKVAVNGVLDSGVDTAVDGTGFWSFTMGANPGSGAIMVFFRDGEATASEEATTVVKYDGAGDVTLVKMYESQLVIGTDTGSTNTDQTITNADLDTSGNGYENDADDEDVLYSIASGVLTVDDDADKTEQLYVIAGDTFRPDSAGGDTVTTHNLEFEGTYTTDNNQTNVAGDFTNAGTFTASTGTITFNGTAAAQAFTTNGAAYNAITLNNTASSGATDDINVSGNLDIDGLLTITDGDLDLAASDPNVTTAGDVAIGASGLVTKSDAAATWTFDGTTQNWSDASAGQDVGLVTINGAPTTVTLTGSVTATKVDVTASDTLALASSGYSLTLTGTGTGVSRPFIVSGTLTEGTNSTVKFTGGGATTSEVETESYDKVDIDPASTGSTYRLGDAAGTLTMTGNFSVGDSGGSDSTIIDWTNFDPTLNIGGNLLIRANTTWTKSDSATMTLNGTTTPTTITDNNATKQDLGLVTVDGSTKTVNLASSVTVEKMTVGANDTLGLASSGYTLKITGSGQAASKPFTITAGGALTEGTSSTVEYTGSTATDITTETYWNLFVKPGSAGISHHAESGSLNVSGNLEVGNGGNTGTFNLDTADPTVAVSGTITINTSGTLIASGTNGVSVGGNWSNSGTFTATTGSTVTFNGSAAQTMTHASQSFYNLTINNSGADGTTDDVEPSSGTVDVNNDLNITNGDFDMTVGDPIVTLGGNLVIGSSAFVTKPDTGTPAWTFDGTATPSTWSDATSGQDIGLVTINGTAKTVNLANTNERATKLTIGADDTFGLASSGYIFTLTGSGLAASRPFVITAGGTFSAGTNSTFVYAGTGATDIEENVTYHHLEMKPPSGSPTYSLGNAAGGTTNVNGNLTVGDGSNAVTLDTNYDAGQDYNGNITIGANGTFGCNAVNQVSFGGSWDNNGVFTHNNCVASFDASDTDNTIEAGSSSFSSISFAGGDGSGTWTFQTDNVTVDNQLVVDTGDIVVITGVTVSVGSSEVNNDGTISGSGTLRFINTSGGPGSDASSTGVYSSIVRFDASGGNIANTTFDARTYSGQVELYADATITVNRTVTAATSGAYVLSGASSHLYLIDDDAAQSLTLVGDGGINPTFTIGGDLDYRGTANGQESIQTGTGTWTVSGHVNLEDNQGSPQAGLLTATAGHTLVMDGATKTLTTNGQTYHNLTFSGSGTTTLTGAIIATGDVVLNLTIGAGTLTMTGTGNDDELTGGTATLTNLTIDPSSAATITLQTSNLSVTGALTVASGDTLSINTGIVLLPSGATKVNNDGTISGAGTLRFIGTSGGPDSNANSTGSYASITRFDATPVNIGSGTVEARTYDGEVQFYSNSGVAKTITFPTGTMDFNGAMTIESTTSTLDVTGATNDPTYDLEGAFSMVAAGGVETFTTGSGNWNAASSVDLTNGTYTTEGTHILTMDGSGTLTSDNETLLNLTINSGSAVTLAAATHTLTGNLVLGGAGTPVVTGSTINMTGSAKSIQGGSKTLNSLTITDNTTLDTTGLTLGGTLTVAASKTLTVTGVTLTMNSTSAEVSWGNGSSTISGTGTVTFTNGAGGPGTSGVLSTPVRFDSTSGDVATTTFDVRTYGGLVELYSNSTSNRTITFASGSYTFSGAFNPRADNTGDVFVDGGTNSPTVGLTGNLDFTGSGSGTEILAAGDGTWTVSGDVNFTDGVYGAQVATLTPSWDDSAVKTESYSFSCTPSIDYTCYSGTDSSKLVYNRDDNVTDCNSEEDTDTFARSALKFPTANVNDSATVTKVELVAQVETAVSATVNLKHTTSDSPDTWACSSNAQMFDNLASGTAYASSDWSATGKKIVDLGSTAVSDVQGLIDPGESLGLSVTTAEPSVNAALGAIDSVDGSPDPILRVIYALGTTSTLIMNGSGKTLTTAGNHVYNLTLSGTITLANGVIIYGNLDLTGGDVTPGTSYVQMVGAGTTLTAPAAGDTLYSVAIDPITNGTVTLAAGGGNLTVSTVLSIGTGDTLSLGSGRTLTLSGTSGTTLTNNGTISGAGTLIYQNVAANPFPATGTISSILRMDATGGDQAIGGTNSATRTFGGVVEIYNSSGTTNRTVTLENGTARTFTFSSHLYIIADSATNNATLSADTATDPTVNVTGDVDFTGTLAGSEAITSGSGTWTVSGNIDFTGGTYDATTGNTVTLNGLTSVNLDSACANTDSCANQNFYNLIINKTDAADGNDNVTLSNNGINVANTLTITDGELIQGALNVRAEGSTAVSIAAAGKWSNISTGDIKLGGSLANAGTLRLDVQGNSSGCLGGDTDEIALTSTDGVTVRSISGAGTFTLYDVTVNYMNATVAITVNGGTDGGTNTGSWTFTNCGITVSGTVFQTSNEGTGYDCNADNLTLKVAVNGDTTPDTGTCSAANGTFSISAVTDPAGADVPIALYIDTGETPKGTLVTLSASAGANITGLSVMIDRVVVTQQSATALTNAHMSTADNGNAGVRYNVAAGALTVESGMELHVLSGKQFTPGGAVTTTATGTAAGAAGDLHIAGTMTMGTNALNVGGDYNNAGTFNKTNTQTTTLTATGSGFTVTPGTGDFNNLTVSGDAGGNGTYTLSGADLTVDGTLTVNTGDTLTIDTSRTLTNTGGNANNDGTINGAGTLRFTDVSGGPDTNANSTGSYSSIVRFDASAADITTDKVDGRTYDGAVQFYANSGTAKTITLSTGTMDFNSTMSIEAAGAGTLNVTGVTNDPVYDLEGDFSMVAAGGVETFSTGNGNWNAAGAVNLTNGTYTTEGTHTLSMDGASKTLTTDAEVLNNLTIAGTGTTTLADTVNAAGDVVLNSTISAGSLVMTGAGKNLTGGAATLTNLTISNSSGTITHTGSDLTVGTLLTISSSGNLTLDTGRIMTLSRSAGGNSIVMTSGTLNGPGTLAYQLPDSVANFPTDGTLGTNTVIRFDTVNGNQNVPARTDYDTVVAYKNSTSIRSVILGTAASQTLTLSANLDIQNANATNVLTLDGNTNTPVTMIITGNVTNSVGTGDVTLSMGAGTWTVSGNFDLTNVDTFNHNSGTLTMDGAGTGTLTSNSKTLNNFTINASGNKTLAAATHTLAGNLSLGGSGTPVVTGSTISMTGSGKTITGGGKTLEGLALDGNGTTTLQTSDLTVSGTLNVTASDTLVIDTSRTLTHTGASLTLAGTIDNTAGSGTLEYQSTTAFPTGGTISADLRMYPATGDQTLSARTSPNGYAEDVELYNNSGSARVITLGAGTNDIGGVLTLNAQSGNLEMRGTTNDPVLNVTGALTCNASAATETLTAPDTGSVSWTFSNDVNLTNCTYTASAETLVMNGTAPTLTTASNTLNNFTTSGTGTITLANATHTIAGNVTFGASAALTAGTSTVTMTGTSNTIDGAGETLSNLTINPASAGTITMQNTDLTVADTLTVSSGDALTINNAARTLTLSKNTATSLVITSGTLNGPGVLAYQNSATTFPTDGALGTSTNVRFDTKNGNMTIPDRPDYDIVEAFGDSANARTVTLGAGTITTSSDFRVVANAASPNHVTLQGATNDPTLNVGGDFDFTGTNTADELVIAPDVAATWTVAGHFDISNSSATPWTASAETLKMTGDAKNLIAVGETIANVTIDGTDNTVTVTGSDLTVSGTLTIGLDAAANTDTLSIGSGRTVSATGTTTITGSGDTISGDGTLRFTDTSSGPSTTGTLSSVVRYDASTNDVPAGTFDARTYGGKVELYSGKATAANVSCADAVTYITSGATSHLHLLAAGDGSLNLLCDTATDPVFTIAGDLDFMGGGAGNETITSGAGIWTVSGHTDFTGGTYTATSSNTLKMNGTTKNLTTAGNSLSNFEVTGGSITQVGALTVAGTFVQSGTGAFTQAANNDLTVTGTAFTLANGTTFTKASGSGLLVLDGNPLDFTDSTNAPKQDLGNVRIGASPATTNLHSDTSMASLTIPATDTYNTHGYEVDVSGALDCQSTCTLSLADSGAGYDENNGSIVTVGANYTMSATGTFTNESTGGRESKIYMKSSAGADTNRTITTGGKAFRILETDNAGATNDDMIVSGNLTVTGALTVTDGQLDLTTNDPTTDVDGAITIASTGDLVASNSAAFTAGGNYTNNGAFTDSGGTITFDGAAQQTLSGQMTGSGDDFNNLTITNASGSDPDSSPSIILAAGLDTAGTFLANTANTKIRFTAGSTYTLVNIDFNGQATGTRVFLRSSTPGTQWNLTSTGTQAVSYTNVRDSNACGGDTIDGSNGTNIDAGNNTCWNINTITFTISDTTIGFGTCAPGAARYASSDALGSATDVVAHTLQATTNAVGGYNITYNGATLTSGGNTISVANIDNDVDGDTSGNTEQFAMSIATNGNATIDADYTYTGSPDWRFVAGATTQVISETVPTAVETFSLHYLCNVSGITEPGAYSTNITYIMTATF